MGPPQWADLGIFLQNFMLLAKEAGLATCAQEAWVTQSESVSKFVEAKTNLMLFCGMAVGYRDSESPINRLISDRDPLKNWSTIIQ
jgi:nitroreductase